MFIFMLFMSCGYAVIINMLKLLNIAFVQWSGYAVIINKLKLLDVAFVQ